jgi:hypothetical protein
MDPMTHFPKPLATLACSLLLSFPLGAQNTGATAPRPGWFPRQVFTDANPRLPRGDRAIIEANLAAAEALVVKSEGYATPRGFEITPWWAYATARSRDRLSIYQMQIHAHVPSRKASAGGQTSTLDIIFNPDPPLCDAGTQKDEDGQPLYFEPPRAAAMHGATAVYGTFGEPNTVGLCVLFTSGGESPLLPVSRERYLRALIFEFEGKDQEELKRQKAMAPQTPYQEWMSGAAQRKKDREEALASLADKTQAAKMRAELEKVEREVTENMKKNEPRDRAMLSQLGNSVAGDKLRAQIAAMTPTERASQGWVLGTELVAAGTPGAQRIVKQNPAFYRARRSPVEPRAILVHLHNVPTAVMAAHSQLYRQFDWAALKRLLDAP